jgi:diaminohydroxyphosphoribosylaminopyrimidine deaminase/5-amino-6-(5-phosphoribosylamino)uracil reductase
MSSALHADQAYETAIALDAKQGQYSTKPNPNVGCVIVKDGQLLGQVITLKRVSHMQKFLRCVKRANSQGATAYVTLEPCAHYGRTPPCAKGLVKRVAQSCDCLSRSKPWWLVKGTNFKRSRH